MKIKVTTKNSDDEELHVASLLETIVGQYDCPIFTKEILIEKGSIPHSHPILTLNTRKTEPILILETFVHEQFHWFAWHNPMHDACMDYLKKYSDLGDCNKLGRYPNSFWEHLIVNWNTRSFVLKNFTKEQLELLDDQWRAYPLTEKFVRDNFEALKKDLVQFGMVYDAISSLPQSSRR